MHEELLALIKKQYGRHSTSPLRLNIVFFHCNETLNAFLTCPIDWYKSVSVTGFYVWLLLASVFLLCKSIFCFSGLRFKCRSINLQVPAWCLQMILAQRRAKGALTLMTPAGCQLWTGLGWPCKLVLDGWVDSRIAGWAGGWVLGWQGRKLKKNNKVSSFTEHIQHLTAALWNADVLKMVVMKLKVTVAGWSREFHF